MSSWSSNGACTHKYTHESTHLFAETDRHSDWQYKIWWIEFLISFPAQKLNDNNWMCQERSRKARKKQRKRKRKGKRGRGIDKLFCIGNLSDKLDGKCFRQAGRQANVNSQVSGCEWGEWVSSQSKVIVGWMAIQALVGCQKQFHKFAYFRST